MRTADSPDRDTSSGAMKAFLLPVVGLFFFGLPSIQAAERTEGELLPPPKQIKQVKLLIPSSEQQQRSAAMIAHFFDELGLEKAKPSGVFVAAPASSARVPLPRGVVLTATRLNTSSVLEGDNSSD